jgi:hypothetical protein
MAMALLVRTGDIPVRARLDRRRPAEKQWRRVRGRRAASLDRLVGRGHQRDLQAAPYDVCTAWMSGPVLEVARLPLLTQYGHPAFA